jgi:hypothetical protein
MTRSEWLKATNPHELLAHLGDNAGDRKLRLVACACARRAWALLRDKRTRKAIEIAERYADGLVVAKKVILASEAAGSAVEEAPTEFDGQIAMVGYRVTHANTAVAARETLGMVINAAARLARETCLVDAEASKAWTAAAMAELTAQAKLVRDIFGNPWRSAKLKSSWVQDHKGAVVRLAQTIYDERAFASLPKLAHALEKAGCRDSAILAHCRGTDEHVRGCWVLDLLLGKA